MIFQFQFYFKFHMVSRNTGTKLLANPWYFLVSTIQQKRLMKLKRSTMKAAVTWVSCPWRRVMEWRTQVQHLRLFQQLPKNVRNTLIPLFLYCISEKICITEIKVKHSMYIWCRGDTSCWTVNFLNTNIIFENKSY